jgi:hypothetical protein
MDGTARGHHYCRMGLLVVAILHFVVIGLMLWDSFRPPAPWSSFSPKVRYYFARVVLELPTTS